MKIFRSATCRSNIKILHKWMFKWYVNKANVMKVANEQLVLGNLPLLCCTQAICGFCVLYVFSMWCILFLCVLYIYLHSNHVFCLCDIVTEYMSWVYLCVTCIYLYIVCSKHSMWALFVFLCMCYILYVVVVYVYLCVLTDLDQVGTAELKKRKRRCWHIKHLSCMYINGDCK